MADWDTGEAGYSAELMARAGAAPPATFGQIWDANWKATGLDTLTGSGQPLEDAFNKLVDAASARLGPIPAAARDAGLDYAGARGFAGKALVIQKLAGALPDDQQKELAPLFDFRARAADTAAKIERDASDINGRTYGLSGNATAWLAGMARQMVDPVNVALLPVGGGEGGLLISAGRQALIAGLGQAAQEPVIQRNRGELGLESGLGQAAGDVGNVVAGTAALGLGLPLLFRGAAWAGRKAFARPEGLPAVPAPPSAPDLLALPPPSHFPRYDEALITPNYNRPLALPPPTIHPAIFEAGRDLVGRLEGEQGASLPVIDTRALHLLSEEAGLRDRDQLLANNFGQAPQGSQEAAELMARVQEVERQAAAAPPSERKALLARRDELLADTTPEALHEMAAPLEQRRVIAAERAAIGERLNAIGEERARNKAEQIISRPISLGERMPVRKIIPHDTTLEAFHSVAPGDLEAAALLADRDVVIPGGAGVEEAAARVERGEPLPPREPPAGAERPPAPAEPTSPARASVEQKNKLDYMVRSTEDTGDVMSLRVQPDAVQVGIVSVSPKNQRQGVGTALYEKAIEFAEARGLPLRSDRAVSASASRVYEGLRRRGYDVTEMPLAVTTKQGNKSAVGSYVYEVRSKRASTTADLPFPAEEKTPAPKLEGEPPKKPAEGEAAAKPIGNSQLAADAERALGEAGGDLKITIDDGAGGVREISARQAIAEAEEDAAAARELEACIGGITEEELP